MNFRPDAIASLQQAGYTTRQAQFLYLVATHSGYFLVRHFLKFTNTSDGKAVRAFLSKAIENQHIREEPHSDAGANRYRFFSRRLYASIGKENSSNRKRHEPSKIVVKLETLDLVLDHLDADYLEEEPDKVCYFHEELGIEKHLLPARIYNAWNSKQPPCTRYFVDKYPLFIAPNGQLAFTYIDDPLHSTQAFRTHLLQYLALFEGLPAKFHVHFVSAVEGKFHSAERAFHSIISLPVDFVLDHEVENYFDLRHRWEAEDLTGFTPLMLRQRVQGAKKYSAFHYEELYKRWLPSQDRPAKAVPSSPKLDVSFATYYVQT